MSGFIQDYVKFYINSANRVTGTPSDFIYSLPIPQGRKFDSVAVLQACIPLSYYLITKGNNTFIIKEIEERVITIPEGNYNASNFATTLKTLLNSGPNGWVYNCSLPSSSEPSTGKYKFTVTNNTAQPEFTFPIDSDLYRQFGFSKESRNVFVNNELYSASVVIFIPETSVFIHSDICDNISGVNILQEVYSNNTVPFSNITYLAADVEAYTKKLRTNESNVFSFTVCDHHKHTLDTNGLEVLMTILVYRKQTFPHVFKNYLRNLQAIQNANIIEE